MQLEGELICLKFCSNWYEFRMAESNDKEVLCNKIEEYDSSSDTWKVVGEFLEPIESDIKKSQKLNKLSSQIKEINSRESSGVIRPFTKFYIVQEVEK